MAVHMKAKHFFIISKKAVCGTDTYMYGCSNYQGHNV